MDSEDSLNWWKKRLPYKDSRTPDNAAIPFWMYHHLERCFLRGLRFHEYNLKSYEQFQGLQQVGPMNAYQWMDFEKILEDRYEEAAEA